MGISTPVSELADRNLKLFAPLMFHRLPSCCNLTDCCLHSPMPPKKERKGDANCHIPGIKVKHIDKIRDTLAPIMCHINLHVSNVVSHILGLHIIFNKEAEIVLQATWSKMFSFL